MGLRYPGGVDLVGLTGVPDSPDRYCSTLGHLAKRDVIKNGQKPSVMPQA